MEHVLKNKKEKPEVETDTVRKAFCKACKRPVPLPHECPVDGFMIIVIPKGCRSGRGF